MPVLAKLHRRLVEGREVEVLALCDRELLGRVFRQRGRVLDLKAYRAFYDGEKVSEGKAIELLKQAKNANVVGEQAVEIARKALNVKAGVVKRIAGVPHLQIYYV